MLVKVTRPNVTNVTLLLCGYKGSEGLIILTLEGTNVSKRVSKMLALATKKRSLELPNDRKLLKSWSGRLDLNQRPLRPERSALPG